MKTRCNFLSKTLGFITNIDREKKWNLEVLVDHIKFLLEKATIFTTSALLVIAFMWIFWVLDEISD